MTFDTYTADEFYNFAYKGLIKAGHQDLVKDLEVMQKYDDFVNGCDSGTLFQHGYGPDGLEIKKCP